MNVEMADLAFKVAQFLLTGGVGIYVYMSNRDKVTNDRITEMEASLDTKLDDHSTRIARLEVKAEHAPTHEDLGAIHEKMNGVSGKLDHMSGEFGRVKELLGVIHEYILTEGKK